MIGSMIAAGMAVVLTAGAGQAAPQTAQLAYAVPVGPKVEAAPTGFFQTRKIDGRWWLVDPDGHLFFIIGTDHIRYQGHWCEKLGYNPYERENDQRYGGPEKWAESTLERLGAWGFNTLAWGHSDILRRRGLPHLQAMTMGAAFARRDALCPPEHWTGFPNVFSPDWPKFCDEFARRVCERSKDDRWLIGYFLDNELDWFSKSGREWGLFNEAWKLPPEHTAKQAWLAHIEAEVKSPEAFERGWGVKVAALAELAGHREPVAPRTEAARQVAAGFVREVARRYFEVAASAVRAHDPNHLVFGCRFAQTAPDVWDIVGQHCDVISVNQYPMADLERGIPDYLVERLAEWHRKAGKPLIITEWSFPAYDTELPSTVGAGMRVDTQAQRAACFHMYQSLLFRLPFMVGSDFFMWVDEPALGIRGAFPENSNYGLVNERDEPYAELTRAATELNRQVYDLHAAASPYEPRREGLLANWLRETPAETLPVESGPMRFTVGDLELEGPIDGEAWRISSRGTPLGKLHPALRLEMASSIWRAANGGRITAIRRNARVTLVEMELSYTDPPAGYLPADQAASTGGTGQYVSSWRFWIPADPSEVAWFAGECVGVRNLDAEPWWLETVYYSLRGPVGGSAEGDELMDTGAPHYYRRGGAWIDRTAGLGLGVWFPVGVELGGWFWTDAAGPHPDLYRFVRRIIPPGKRVPFEGMPAFFFPLRELSREGFVDASWKIERAALKPPSE